MRRERAAGRDVRLIGWLPLLPVQRVEGVLIVSQLVSKSMVQWFSTLPAAEIMV